VSPDDPVPPSRQREQARLAQVIPAGRQDKAASRTLQRRHCGGYRRACDDAEGEVGNGTMTTTFFDAPVRAKLPAGVHASAVACGPEASVSLAIEG
jgi:hypothetical protein